MATAHRFSALMAGAICALLGVGSLNVAHAQGSSRAVSTTEWNNILAAARKEGKVIVYGTMAVAQHERIQAEFSKAHPGIKMELVRVVGSALTTKLEQERAAPNVEGADVMLTADVRWAIDAQKKGWLKTPVGPNAQAWPAPYIKNGQIVYLGISPWIMNYNTNLVKTPINTYEDLLRPDLAGKVGTLPLVAEVVTAWYMWLDQTHPGYLEKLAAHNVKIYPASTAATAATAAGEISATAFTLAPIDNAQIARGAPIRSVLPNPAQAFSFGGAIVSWAKNPNAATVVMDFLMSVPGQSAIVGKQESASPLPNVPGAIDISKMNVHMLDWEQATPEALKTFSARWNKLFGAR